MGEEPLGLWLITYLLVGCFEFSDWRRDARVDGAMSAQTIVTILLANSAATGMRGLRVNMPSSR